MKTPRFAKMLLSFLLLATASVVVSTAATSESYIAAQGPAPLLSATSPISARKAPGGEQAMLLAAAGDLRLWGVRWSTVQANGVLGHHPTPTVGMAGVEDGRTAAGSAAANAHRIYLPLMRGPDHPIWEIILQDGFEGPWPGPWELDYNEGTNPYLWAKRDCRPYQGGFSAWVAGDNAGPQPSCGANYPDNLFTYMLYGPFSLTDATAAELTFQLWLSSPRLQDEMYWGASLDGQDFWGFFLSGNSNGWQEFSLDLRYIPTLGDLTGEPQVWIVLVFISDIYVSLPEGAYVDDVLLRKASSMPEAVTWQEFSFTGAGEPARGCRPADPGGPPCGPAPNAEFAGAPPWMVSVPPEGATLRVADGWYSGDVFDVYDHGSWIGRTSTADLSAECFDPDTCYRNPGMSSGEFPLAAGPHSITIVPSSSPHRMGAAFFRVD